MDEVHYFNFESKLVDCVFYFSNSKCKSVAYSTLKSDLYVCQSVDHT